MFTKNDELNKMIKEETKLKEEDLIKAVKAVLDIKKIIPKMLSIDSMQMVNAKAIDQEIEDRKNDTKLIKDNYIKRFDKVDDLLDVIFDKIEKVRAIGETSSKSQIKFLWGIVLTFLGCSLFLYVTMVWDKLIALFF